MSDRLADIIAQKFQDAAPKFAEAFHADRYELLSVTRGRDAYGINRAEGVEAVVEVGYCALLVVTRDDGEQMQSDVVFTSTSYQVEIKPPTIITTKHRVRINGRVFEVKNVIRGGEMETFVIAALEELEPR